MMLHWEAATPSASRALGKRAMRFVITEGRWSWNFASGTAGRRELKVVVNGRDVVVAVWLELQNDPGSSEKTLLHSMGAFAH
jgi:hypothetical protein